MIRVAPAGRRERGKPIGPSRQSDCLERCCPASCTRLAFAARATALAGPLWTVGSVRFVGSVGQREPVCCTLSARSHLAFAERRGLGIVRGQCEVRLLARLAGAGLGSPW